MSGRIAVVSGAAGAIGSAVCARLASDGDLVVGLDLIAGHGITVCDVSDENEVEGAFSDITRTHGTPTVLINAVGITGAGGIEEEDPATWRRILEVNLTSAYLCSRQVVGGMRNIGEGKIVNISSSAGKRGSPNTLAYNAANFAVVGMTQSMAREFGPMGVNVNCVCPGAVDTHRMDDLGRGDTWTNMAANTPIGRNGTDEEIGDFIAYPCTEAASWIQGQSINLNGGTIMEH